MTHPLVDQLRFARSEFQRGLAGLTDDEARTRFQPMNCISWNIGHLAWQEQRYWLTFAQDLVVAPEVNEVFRNGAPASQPPLADAWRAWETITAAADPWLDTLTADTLVTAARTWDDGTAVTYGSLLLRTTYHYWYHTGENAAIRQQLGHSNLPEFVGDLDSIAPFCAG